MRAAILLTSLLSVWSSCVLLPSALAQDPAPEFLLEWGKPGEGPGEFHSPIGVAFNSREELLVTDLNNARIQKFSTTGELLGGFDLPRDNPERKSTMAAGIAIDDEDLIYLTNMVRHTISVYRESGELVREWGVKGPDPGQINQPGGIVVTPDGFLLLADQGNHRIQKLTRTGEFVAQWGHHGSNPGEFGGLGNPGSRFGGPHFVGIDSQQRMYTTEGFAGHVQQLAADGTSLSVWGNKSDEPGGFGGYTLVGITETVGPVALAVDRSDRIWVSSLNDRVQCFDPQGRFLFGITGTGRPDDTLLHPHGMAFDREGNLYLADSGNQRIVKFRIPVSLPATGAEQ